MTGFRYKAFISYSHDDDTTVRWLHRALETYSLPRGLRGHTEYRKQRNPLTPIFRDREELVAASSLSEAIVSALENSEFLIVVCSPAARASHWVEQELATFKELRSPGNVIAVLVDGDSTSSFPPSLLRDRRTDGSYTEIVREPLAADIQGGRADRRLALHKLAAAMLQVELDQLIQREHQRRVRFLSSAAAVAMVATLFMSWLTATAINERRKADTARASAEHSAKIADQRRRQSEELISFMVGDLRESLRPLGKLALLDRVGDKAVAYFESLDAAAINDRSLLLQAEVLTQVGEIRMWQFQYDTAIDVFEQAQELADMLVQRNNSDGDMLFRRSQTEYWIGDMHWRGGNLDEAERWLRRYQQSSLALNALAPERSDWEMEVAYGHHNLAVLEMDRANLAGAKALFEKELEILRHLDATVDEEQDVRFELSDAYSWLGKIALREGELESARRDFDESSRYLSELLAESPEDAFLKFYYIVASGFGAEVRAIMGEIGESESRYKKLIGMLESMVENDRENVQQGRAYARMNIDFAELALSVESALAVPAALDSAGMALTDLRRMHEQTPEDRRTLVSLIKGLRVTATLKLLTGKPKEALSLLQQALRLNPRSSDDLELTRELGTSLVVAKEAVKMLFPPSDWEPAWLQREADFLESASEVNDPLTRDAYARILAQGGLVDQAERVRRELELAGYRPLRPWGNY